jgi:hypothetical protein
VIAAIDPTPLIAAATLSVGAVGSVLTYRKVKAEAESIAARTLIEVNEDLRKELTRREIAFKAELARRDAEITRLNAEVERLRESLSVLQRDFEAVAERLQNLTRRP